MACRDPGRRLIVNADDFGRSHSINQAVLRAHADGILTTASLMVSGNAFEEAVDLAHQNPRLGVGLHLTLVCGRSVLPSKEIPGLIRTENNFSDRPVGTGIRYCFRRSLRSQLEREVAGQFLRFRETGLRLDHINGHLNMHLHPTVFRMLTRQGQAGDIPPVRLTRDPLRLNLKLAPGRWLYRFSHAAVFTMLSWWARPRLSRQRIRHTDHVFGLLQSGNVDEEYLLKLLPQLPAGDSELYSHPCTEHSRKEFHALISAQVRQQVQQNRIQLIRYQDL